MKRWDSSAAGEGAAGRRPAAPLRPCAAAAWLLALFVLSCLPSVAQTLSASPRPLSQVDTRPAASPSATNPPGTDRRVNPGQDVAATAQPTPESSWFEYVTEEISWLGVVLLFLIVLTVALVLLFVLPWLIAFMRDMGWWPAESSSQAKLKRTFVGDRGATSDPAALVGGGDSAARTKQGATASAKETGKVDYSEFRRPKTYLRPDAASQSRAEAEAAAQQGTADKSEATEPKPVTAASQPEVWGGPSAEKALSMLRDDLERLRAEFSDRMAEVQRRLHDTADQTVPAESVDKALRETVDKTVREVVWEVVPELAGLMIKQKLDAAQGAVPARPAEEEARLFQRLEVEMNAIQGIFASEVKALSDGLDKLAGRQRSLEKTQQYTHDEVEETFTRVKAVETSARALEELREEVARLKEELEELKAERPADGLGSAVPDSFYARTLGTILGQNVEALRDGNFEQLSRQVCERLNQFFLTEVPHGDKLQALRARAEAVSRAMADVFEQVQRLKPEAAEEAAPHVSRAAALAAELAGLQSQLATRRATVETTLRVPVSLHAGARQSFLDELGRGIRREVDKLSDPQSHFAGELKRLVTDAVVPLVDICDKKVAGPGTQPELESGLNYLSAQAELLPVLPRPGDAFRPAEQEMLRVVQGAPGQSMCVAQVLTRGFYYAQPDGRTLLRKAGVIVYR